MVDPFGMESVNVEYLTLATLTNVEDKYTEVYASLRSISENTFGSSLTWESVGNGGVATYTLENHIIEIYFDNMAEGEYASDIKVYATYGKKIEVTGFGRADYVDGKLSSQEAYFYLKEDENGSGNLVVQAKVSTMFACAGKWSVGSNFIAAWDIGKQLYQKYGKIEGKSLQDYLNDPAVYTLLNVDSDSVLDCYETIMKDRGLYYLD